MGTIVKRAFVPLHRVGGSFGTTLTLLLRPKQASKFFIFQGKIQLKMVRDGETIIESGDILVSYIYIYFFNKKSPKRTGCPTKHDSW